MHRLRRHLWDTEGAPALRDNPSASVTIHATLLWILLLTIPSLMNINHMEVAANDLLLKNIIRNFLCSRVIWGDIDLHATAHAPVITKISDNTTSLIRTLCILLGLIQERGPMCQVRNLRKSAHCDPSRGGKAVLTPYFPSQHSGWKRGSRIVMCLSWQVCRQPRETHALGEWRDFLRLGRARVSELRAGSRHQCQSWALQHAQGGPWHVACPSTVAPVLPLTRNLLAATRSCCAHQTTFLSIITSWVEVFPNNRTAGANAFTYCKKRSRGDWDKRQGCKEKWLFKKKKYKKFIIPVMKFYMHLCWQGHELEKRCKLCYKNNSRDFFKTSKTTEWIFSESCKAILYEPNIRVSCYAVTNAVGIFKGFTCHTTRIQWIFWGMFCSCQISVSLWHSTKQRRAVHKRELQLYSPENREGMWTKRKRFQNMSLEKTAKDIDLSVVSLRMSTCYQGSRNRNSPFILPRYFYAFVTHHEHTYLKPQWMGTCIHMSHIKLYLGRFSGGL